MTEKINHLKSYCDPWENEWQRVQFSIFLFSAGNRGGCLWIVEFPYLKPKIHFRVSWCLGRWWTKAAAGGVLLRKDIFKNLSKFTGKHLSQGLFFNKVAGLRTATLLKKTPWPRCFPVKLEKEVFCKKGVPRNFAKFTGKHLYQFLFLIKFQTWLQFYSKRDSSTGAFLWILQNF